MYETIPTEKLRRQEAAVHDLALDCMISPGREADANLLSREAKYMRDELERRSNKVPPNNQGNRTSPRSGRSSG